jgi:spermidine synthase
MSAMGAGTYLSRLVHSRLLAWFMGVELTIALLGGLSVPLLLVAYGLEASYTAVMVLVVVGIGILIGMEIPLLTRILAGSYSLRANLSNVLSLDYLGALVGTFLFPFALLPFLGPVKSSMVTGMLNLAVGWMALRWLGDEFDARERRFFGRWIAIAGVVLLGTLLLSGRLVQGWESTLYDDRVILAKETPYQSIILTRRADDLRLFLNGHLQFSSVDERRYHESLVHIGAGLAPRLERVLVLGGGDGLAARELLAYPGVKSILLVDLDPVVTELSRSHALLRKINAGSLDDPRVEVHNVDAFEFLENGSALFDLIIADLPDPNSTALARLYSREFYTMARRRLSRAGIFVTQATSPYFARDAFWCIVQTIEGAGFASVSPYHAYVPSMGDWGFILASDQPALDPLESTLRADATFLDEATKRSAFVFPLDSARRAVKESSIESPVVLRYYMEGWRNWR